MLRPRSLVNSWPFWVQMSNTRTGGIRDAGRLPWLHYFAAGGSTGTGNDRRCSPSTTGGGRIHIICINSETKRPSKKMHQERVRRLPPDAWWKPICKSCKCTSSSMYNSNTLCTLRCPQSSASAPSGKYPDLVQGKGRPNSGHKGSWNTLATLPP